MLSSISSILVASIILIIIYVSRLFPINNNGLKITKIYILLNSNGMTMYKYKFHAYTEVK